MCSYCWRQLRREALLCCEILSRLSFLPPNPHPMTPNLSPFRHRRVCVHAHAAVTRSHTHPQHVFNALLTCIVWAPNEQSHPPPAFLTSSLTSIPLPLASRACDVLTARSLAEHRLPFCTATLSLSVLVTLPSCRRPLPSVHLLVGRSRGASVEFLNWDRGWQNLGEGRERGGNIKSSRALQTLHPFRSLYTAQHPANSLVIFLRGRNHTEGTLLKNCAVIVVVAFGFSCADQEV